MLNNRQVLITGGAAPDGRFPSTAELYNPVTGKFTRTAGLMHVGQFLDEATILGDGTVPVVGGLTNQGNIAALSEIYNPTSRKFFYGPFM